MKQNAGYAVLVAAALAVVRFSSGGSAASVQTGISGQSALMQTKATLKPPKTSAYKAGCTAYLGKGAAGDGKKDPNRGEAKSMLDRFFRFDATKPVAAQLAARPGIHYAIALAPDPAHTNLGLLFDREMVAVQQGAQDEGYTYDSSWLPWSGEGAKFPLRADQEAADEDRSHREGCPGLLLFRKSLADPQPEAAKPADPYAEALVVFVVGEQPTGGVNESQWANAVHWLAENTSKEVGTLRILGPTFSGSLVSLERDLSGLYGRGAKSLTIDNKADNLARSFPRVHILSGDVSSCASVRWFQDSLERGGMAPAVRFGGFLENDELQIYRFFSYLSKLGTDIRDTAVLSEDETAYGYHVVSVINEKPNVKKAHSPCDFPYAEDHRPLRLSYPRDISALRTAYEKQSVFSSSGISGKKSRVVLQEGVGDAAEGEATSDTIKSFAGPMSAVGQEAVLYGVVSYLRVHHTRYLLLRCTNPLDFLFLTRFFHRAYPEGRIVTVGSDLLYRREIDTTEFRGVMALTSYPLLPLNQHWSQMTQNGDTPPWHVHRVLESHMQAGTYLAARYLFDPVTEFPAPPPPLPVKRKKRAAKKQAQTAPSAPQKEEATALPRLENLPDYANPFWLPKSTMPDTVAPTWLEVVGRDGYWPLAVLNEQTTPDVRLDEVPPASTCPLPCGAAPKPDSTLVHVARGKAQYPRSIGDKTALHSYMMLQIPMSWKICMGCALLLLLYQWLGITVGTKYSYASGLFSVFRRFRSRSQVLLLGVNCAFAAMLFLAMFSMVWTVLQDFSYVDRGSPEFQACIGLALLVIALLPLALLFYDSAVGFNEHRQAAFYYLAALAVLLWMGYRTMKASMLQANDASIFYRMGHLNSGVSPLLPVLFLLAGMYLWSWQTMAGNALLRCGRPLLPKLRGMNHTFGWLQQIMKRLKGDPLVTVESGWNTIGRTEYRMSREMGKRIIAVASPLSLEGKVIGLPLLLAAGVWFCFHKDLPLLGMEGRGYAVCINLSLLVIFLLTACEASRLFWTWRDLKRLLIQLSRLRLRRTFAKLRAVDAGSLWSMSGNVHRVQYHFFSQQLDALERLSKMKRAFVPSVPDAVECGKKFAEINAGRISKGPRWDRDFFPPRGVARVNIRTVFADTTAELLNVLLFIEWGKEKTSLSLENTSAVAEESERNVFDMKLSENETVRAAEEFVCFQYMAVIQNILARMRTMTLAAGFLFLSACFAISFYPFVPRTEIGLWMTANLVLIGGAVIYVYAGMERDETLSYIANTRPGKLSGEFWIKTAGFLAGPVIGVLTTQFPSIADSVLEWLQPGIDAIK